MSTQGEERDPRATADGPQAGHDAGSGTRQADEDARLEAELNDDAPPITLTPNQAKRASSSARGMLIATGATLAVVLPVYFLNPTHTAETYQRDIDVPTVARQAAGDAGYLPASPELPEGWSSNYARWVTGRSDDVDFWEVGFLTADTGFIQLTQTDDANPTWTAQRIGDAQVSGSRTIGGIDWDLLDAANGDTVLSSEIDGSTVILNGGASLAEFDTMGEAVIEDVRQNAVEEAERLSSSDTDGA
ncbi:DUF4245 domain-containing protein [Arthrobacter agilis]|uniref:DUF4245 domain-containing protein n=1 Tax=Arthrobacter agilis TaxID=37921 RepID=UPI000F6CBB90|nr:DUF4245 domain-containing protein [Arthrobacter agilis]WDF34212.1 DUF4245 domain-containing protein [Arthrobacter agilis]VDR31497.1 Uncharacterised protein [Arthrobacter agilis]